MSGSSKLRVKDNAYRVPVPFPGWPCGLPLPWHGVLQPAPFPLFDGATARSIVQRSQEGIRGDDGGGDDDGGTLHNNETMAYHEEMPLTRMSEPTSASSHQLLKEESEDVRSEQEA